MNDRNVINEKFLRCPHCRSFSVKVANDLNMGERLKAKFLPLQAFICGNCSYRFIEMGKFNNPLLEKTANLVRRVQNKWLLLIVPMAVILLITALFIFLPGNGTPPVPIDKQPVVQKPADNPEDKQPVVTQPQDKPKDKQPVDTQPRDIPEDKQPVNTQPADNPEDKQPVNTQPADNPEDKQPVNTQPRDIPEDKQPQDKQPVNPPVARPQIEAEIILANSNRFGVNWSSVPQGVKITRLSNGPLKKAGIKLGDIFTEVEGQPIKNGNRLIRLRNEIFRGRRKQANIKILRNNINYLFRMVKFPLPKEEAEAETQHPQEKPTTQALSKNSTAAGLQLQGPGVIKVFSRTSIKQRTSSPTTVSRSRKWSFLRKAVSIKRAVNQQVWLAGDATGTKRWGVDDQLIINGKAFDGLAGNYSRQGGLLPDKAKLQPMDITSLVPAGRQNVLRIELADHGKLWANTDIYIIIKSPEPAKTQGPSS